MSPRRTGWILALTLLLCPALAQARTVFGFVPPSGGAEAAELQRDLLARLERTRRYALLEVQAADLAGACAGDKRLEKAAQLVLTKSEKYAAEVRIRDCASGARDAAAVRAGSAKLASLAGALRQDFIDGYPLLVDLELEGGTLLADVGPGEKVEVGDLLYGYRRAPDGGLTLARRLKVVGYDEAHFRSRFEEFFRLPGAASPAAGEQISPRALFAMEAKVLSAPVVVTAATQRIAGPDEIVGGGLFAPPLTDAPLSQAHVLRGSDKSTGRSLAAWLVLEAGATLRLEWKGDEVAYRAALGGAVLRVTRIDDKKRGLEVAALPLPEPIVAGGRTRILVSWNGPWTEFYVGGRFVGGFEDLTLAGRTFEIGAAGGAAYLYEPELFELTIVPKQ
ncbi:MAG: hypothetical protein KDH09_13395 [Chrysiogenetes bacterium]|nr:hypothetical protein [Chrysiogenetes bacterium]